MRASAGTASEPQYAFASMECGRCGTELPGGAAFCPACGAGVGNAATLPVSEADEGGAGFGSGNVLADFWAAWGHRIIVAGVIVLALVATWWLVTTLIRLLTSVPGGAS